MTVRISQIRIANKLRDMGTSINKVVMNYHNLDNYICPFPIAKRGAEPSIKPHLLSWPQLRAYASPVSGGNRQIADVYQAVIVDVSSFI
jgi:hypothetical protein